MKDGVYFTELLFILHPLSPTHSLCFVSVAPFHIWHLDSQ